MKKQLHKIKIAAENFSRPTKADKNSEELLAADRHVEKYKDVLDKICRKFLQNPSSASSSSNSTNATSTVDQDAREKRCKKVHEYKLALAMEESLKDLPQGLLHDVLEKCAELEKNIATDIVDNEIKVENDVTKKLAIIMENHIGTIQKQKRIVTKLMQDNESAKHKYQTASRVHDNGNSSKIIQLREEQEECESKLEKERDIWAAEMFELIAEEDNMANYVINYIKHQQSYYKSALGKIEDVMCHVNDLIKGNNKKIFKVPLDDHLAVTNRTISYVIELCVCCLLEKGLYEEGLLRVGCAGSKLRRLRSAIDANLVTTPYPSEYQDVHVIASALKSYLRDLPDPLLTFKLYDQFIAAAQRPTEETRKVAILNAINQLPERNYLNLRYLMKFLELLSQKHKSNKMSAQNIAIVMSPNLLWSPETSDVDYVSKVNSTASVNTIIEAIVSDWSYFFDEEFTVNDFYVTLSRDELFPHNGGFPVDRDSLHAPIESVMTKSLNIVSNNEMSAASSSGSANHLNESFGSGGGYQTHSRSSSHDTSLILVDSGLSKDSRIKRSQSNSSLSDSSPTQQGSPKLPVRRKHNKQVAPTPPDNRFQRASEHYASISSGHAYDSVSMKERFLNAGNHHHQNDSETNRAQSNVANAANVFKHPAAVSMRQCHGSQENLASKPDKPPRPVMPMVESQTLIRNAFKAKGLDRNGRPVALPRNILNVARSTENLSMSTSSTPSPVKTSPGLIVGAQNRNEAHDDVTEMVLLRDANCSPTENVRTGDKPAIPERPTSLMKSNFRTAIFDKFESNPSFPSHLSQADQTINGIKKTQSFRMSSTGGGNRDSQKGIAVGSITGRSLTTLERTHIYNVEKQQVAFIDVSDQQNSASTPPQGSPKQNAIANGGDKESHLNGSKTSNENQSASTENVNVGSENNNVPQSPRCFEPKVIKRPQIPAPPPPKVPTNATLTSEPNHTTEQMNRKSDGNLPADPVAAGKSLSTTATTTTTTTATALPTVAGDSTNL